MIDNAPRCHVGPSGIHGMGLFSSHPFVRGDEVANYNIVGLWVPKRFDDLTDAELDRSWWIGFNDEWCFVPTEDHKEFFANHSITPNCDWDRLGMRLVANREIPAGEEITYDYRLETCPHSIRLRLQRRNVF